LIELLNFFALGPSNKREIVDRISANSRLPFETCAARLIEELRDYSTYRVIDPESEARTEAEKRMEELHSLTDLMLQSNDRELWPRETIATIGVWTLLCRLADEASRALGRIPTGRIDVESLTFRIME